MNEKKYTGSGLWIEKKEETYTVGLSPVGQEEAGNVAYVDLPLDQQKLLKGEMLLSVEGDKAVTEFTLPFSARVLKWNEELETSPELLDSSSSKDNWVAVLSNVDQVEWERLKKEEKED